MGTFQKLTKPQRRALKTWRREMKQEGYSPAEIDAAIQSGDAADLMQAFDLKGDTATSVVRLPAARDSHYSASTGIDDNWKNYLKNCTHAGTKMLFKVGKADIYAGARWDTRDTCRGAALLIDLTGYTSQPAIEVPAGYESLVAFAHSESVPTMNIDWPDHGLPPVRFEFWNELVRLLPAGKVLVRCIGGHGRTGTALGALLIAGQGMTTREAIATVRRDHCEDAIETASQRNYLRQLAVHLGIKDDPLPESAVVVPIAATPSLLARAEGYDCPKCSYSSMHAATMANHRQIVHGE